MSLIITTQKSRFKGSPAPYFIHSRSSSIISEAAFLDILASARTTYSRPDLAGACALIREELIKLIAEGRYVKTSFGAFYLCASGSLDAVDEVFAPKTRARDHALHVHFRPDTSFERAVVSRASYVRDSERARLYPYPIKALSVKGKRESTGRPGEYIKVSGARLSFDEDDPESGLFFSNESRHRAEAYGHISSTFILAEIPPELEPGDYRLSIRSRPGGKELREGTMSGIFKVEMAG